MDIYIEITRLCYSGYDQELKRVLDLINEEDRLDRQAGNVPNPVNLDFTDEEDGITFLMRAVQAAKGCHHSAIPKYRACIRILVENGADTNLVDVEGRTALHWAVQVSILESYRIGITKKY